MYVRYGDGADTRGCTTIFRQITFVKYEILDRPFFIYLYLSLPNRRINNNLVKSSGQRGRTRFVLVFCFHQLISCVDCLYQPSPAMIEVISLYAFPLFSRFVVRTLVFFLYFLLFFFRFKILRVDADRLY